MCLELYCISKYYGLLPEILDIILILKGKIEQDSKREDKITKHISEYLIIELVNELPYKGNLTHYFENFDIFIKEHIGRITLINGGFIMNEKRSRETAIIISNYYIEYSKDTIYWKYLKNIKKIHDKLCEYLLKNNVKIIVDNGYCDTRILFDICRKYFGVSDYEYVRYIANL